jgi:hypothetical protein
MLYLAYGSNLHRGQMKFRCPLAKPLGKVLVPDFRLVFRGVADIEEYKGASCPMGLWEISDACEKALDIYEGFPHLYRKLYFDIDGKVALTYTMNTNRIAPPSRSYFDTIARGYEDFSLDQKFLYDARTDANKESAYNMF